MRLNKERIQRRFNRAAATYDRQAVIQLQVADKLVELMQHYIDSLPARILEIGSCTGLLTARLHKLYPGVEELYANDLVPSFQPAVRERLGHDPRLNYLPGDIERIDIPGNLDLVVSSSTLHWLEDLPALLEKLHQAMVPGAALCFSIYGTDNLKEMRQLTGIGLDYYCLADLQTLVSRYFEVVACSEEIVHLRFPDPLAILNHLRETGVNGLDETPWTRKRLDTFLREYGTRFNCNGEVELTYHPMYCLAQKPG